MFKNKKITITKKHAPLAPALKTTCVAVLAIGISFLSGCSLFSHHYKPDLQATGGVHQNMNQGDYNAVRHRAQAGDANAQYNMGYRYYYGIGVKEDVHRAKSWFARSASRGNHLAKQALHDIRLWEGNYRDDGSYRTPYTPAPSYLPPPPSNRHKFSGELEEDHGY
jgi:hypothetical protein